MCLKGLGGLTWLCGSDRWGRPPDGSALQPEVRHCAAHGLRGVLSLAHRRHILQVRPVGKYTPVM